MFRPVAMVTAGVLVCVFGVVLRCGAVQGSSGADWWKRSIIYQIYPRSFQDSDGDGVGDIAGIRSRLDHFLYLGVDTIWISPMYKSPMRDFGYDVQDFKDIDPLFGTLENLDILIKDMHAVGLRLLMDFIPNHTSDLHPWFVASSASRDGPYADYYCWHDGIIDEHGNRQPPSNWITVFGGSSWTWHEGRQQYYLHQYLPTQPDLNYRSPAVRKEMLDVLDFWLSRGVDGFRVDAIQVLMEDVEYRDEEPSGMPGCGPTENCYLRHDHTVEHPDLHDVIREWRQLFDKYDKHVLMISEVFVPRLDDTTGYVGNTTQAKLHHYSSGADFPFNFYLLQPDRTSCGGECFYRHIAVWWDGMEDGMWPNFVLGNHDMKRVSSRMGHKYASALNLLLLMLPGTPTTYYGEEIGMLDIQVSYQDTIDPWGRNAGPDLYEKYSRDPCRSPMQWTRDDRAGFSTSPNTWLPLHPQYQEINVQEQMDDISGFSVLQVYHAAARLRRTPTLRQPARPSPVYLSDEVLSILREAPDLPAFLIILHLGDTPSLMVPFTEHLDHNKYLVEEASVYLMTRPMHAVDDSSRQGDDSSLHHDSHLNADSSFADDAITNKRRLMLHSLVNPNDVVLNPGDGIVLRLNRRQIKDEL